MISSFLADAVISALLGYVTSHLLTPKPKKKTAAEFESQWAEMAAKQRAATPLGKKF